MKIDKTLITIDRAFDFAPGLSILNNLVALITKVGLAIFFKCTNRPREDFFQKRLYLHYIDQKSYFEIIFLMIPVVNIVIAFVKFLDRRVFVVVEAETKKDIIETFNLYLSVEEAWEGLEEKFQGEDLDQIRSDLDEIHEKLKKLKSSSDINIGYNRPSLKYSFAYSCVHNASPKPFLEAMSKLELEKDNRKRMIEKKVAASECLNYYKKLHTNLSENFKEILAIKEKLEDSLPPRYALGVGTA